MSIIILGLYSLSFVSIGLWLALQAQKRNWLPKEFLFIGVLASSLVVYYFLFYGYLINPVATGWIVRLLFVLSIGLLAHMIVECRRSATTFSTIKKFFLPPLLITLVFMFIYSTIFYSCMPRRPAVAGYQELDNRTFCYTEHLPFDNSLGFIFGENVLRNQDTKQAIDWNLADRPPLQIAATLPILDQAGHSSQLLKYVGYHVFSVFLQLSWVGAFWGVFQLLLKNKRKYMGYVFLGLGSTGFFFLNSIFVWPKLLAASMVFTGVILFLGKPRDKVDFNYLPFAAVLLSLGLLSHAGVLFTIVPFVIFLAVQILRSKSFTKDLTKHVTKNVNLRYMAAAAAIAIVMLAPWYAYKGSVTTSDRLVKWHFAGITSAQDTRGTFQTIIEEYQKITPAQWLHLKTHNTKTLVTGDYNGELNCPLRLSSVYNKCIFTEWRSLTFFSTVFAFECFNIGWIVFFYRAYKRRLDRLDRDLLIVTLGGLAFWVLAIFIPGDTIVHAGSYATMMLLFLFLVKNLVELPWQWVASIASLQTFIFYMAWISAFHIAP